MSFKDIQRAVELGQTGGNEGIPTGFNRLEAHVSIRKSMYYLIGGLTGSGKTSFVEDAFILNPYDWYKSPENKTKTKLTIIYRSMERGRLYKQIKWISRKIFMDYGKIIPVAKLLKWRGQERLTKDEHDLFLLYEDYINEMEGVVKIIDGPENPIGIAKELREHALLNGRIEQLDEYNKIYIPNNENEITIVVLDHIGLLKETKELNTKKATIDKMSNELRYVRDFFGYTPVVVSQFNRDISNPMRLKAGDVEPQLEDFADSSATQNDADVVMALFDCVRYKVADASGYNTDKLIDESGANFFRSLRVIKNSYGSDNLRIGLAFFGQLGTFREMPRKKDITEADYEAIINKSYFLK